MLSEFIKDKLAARIAGEIVLSKNPGETMKKWRLIFGVRQLQLASFLGFSPSVISDYEGGRRKSPGSQIIRRFVLSLIKIDELKGGEKLNELATKLYPEFLTPALVDMGEFTFPVKIKMIQEVLEAKVLYGTEESLNSTIYGYTIIDSIKAIKTLSGDDFLKFFGLTTQRALIFTKVGSGRSPMVAIRVRGFKPATVILHGPEEVDPLAIELAKIENLPLMVSRLPTPEEIAKKIRSLMERGGGI